MNLLETVILALLHAEVVRSLWAGLMTWMRWRRYIQLTESLTLTDNFISYAHYITLKLLAHGGINHQLALYHAFPHLNSADYNMRNTGNRGLEAIHCIFRGGSSCLPITAPNLTFQEFLSRMNKTSQIHRAEHELKLIDGNSVVASKKKRKTCSRHSKTDNPSDSHELYTLPSTYPEFVEQLKKACLHAGRCMGSQKYIHDLAPQMAAALKLAKEWDNPRIAIEAPPSKMSIIASISDSTPTINFDLYDELIESVLGPHQTNSNSSHSNILQASLECLLTISMKHVLTSLWIWSFSSIVRTYLHQG